MIIAAFPKGSFPTNTWPVGTWPEAFTDNTDIQYTEVFEFEVEAVLEVEFDVVLPTTTALFTVEMPMLVEMEVYEELSL